ncbi:MAG: pseudaminic acid cytidylyltransferase [Candidatus Marinimicrobia bacterium]|nr:pseudaminic acid cytidylyltransferase [Candidatus Neomarinimicrobiota bacterium]
MKKIAIIPARGGSKRIPKKNIMDFFGKPILAYSIEAAIGSNLFDEIMVSTDNPEIAEIAQKYGASIPFMRSDENADDHATTASVLKEVIFEYDKVGLNYDHLCCIYPAAPLITASKLAESYKLLSQGKADSVISVVRYNHPIQRALVVDKKGFMGYKWPENALKRSQDIKETFHDAGQLYWCKIDAFLNEHTLVTKRSVAFVESELSVQDIDSNDDIAMARLKYMLVNDIKDHR